MSNQPKDINNVCDSIELLSNTFKNDSHDLLYEKVMLALSGLTVSGLFVQLNNITLNRIRLNCADNKRFEKTNDLYYPPANYVSCYGRVNRPGQSMLYCSEYDNICEMELLHDYLLKNDIGHERLATYSKWELKKNLNMMVIAIPPSNREISNGFTIRNQCFEFVKQQNDDHKIAYSNQYTLTERFFFRNAKLDPSVYVICSAIANALTLTNPDIDGLIYPTVPGSSGYNFVIRPHVLDKGFIAPKSNVMMRKWLISDKKTMTIDHTYEMHGRIENEKIIWT